MLTSVHPLVLAAAVGALMAAVALLAAWLIRSSAVRRWLIIVAFVFLLPAAYLFATLNPWLVDSRFRTYRAFYRDIHPGMTREQVLAVMERRYPTGGARQRPTIMDDTPDRLGFFMNPEMSSEPNCEGIFLTLQQGRVTKKEYSPD